jgi:hypothetical protein
MCVHCDCHGALPNSMSSYRLARLVSCSPMVNPRCTDHNVARTMTRINGIAYRVLPWALGRARAEQSGAVAQWRRSREHSSQASSTATHPKVLDSASGERRVLDRAVEIFRGEHQHREAEGVQTARYHGCCAMGMDQAIFPTNTCSWLVAKVPRYHSGSAHWGSRDPSRAKRSTVAQRLPRQSWRRITSTQQEAVSKATSAVTPGVHARTGRSAL